MELIGRITEVLPLQEGVSKAGKPWKKRVYVLETQETYPKKVAFTAFGEDRVSMFDRVAQPGSSVKLSFDIESREYQGRWYTDISGWRIEAANGDQAAAPQAAAAAPAATIGAVPPPPAVDIAPAGPTDDLPF